MDKSERYTKVPNDILEKLCYCRLSPLQIQVILYVIRKTSGYQKEMDTIAVTKMAKDIKRPRSRVSTAVNELEKLGILEVQRTGYIIGNRMRVAPPSEWSQSVTKSKHVTKTEHVTKSKHQVLRKRNSKCYENVTHKRKYTKENITKETPYIPQEKNEGFADRPFGEMYTPEEEERLRAEGWT